jgi:hypothetical protein
MPNGPPTSEATKITVTGCAGQKADPLTVTLVIDAAFSFWSGTKPAEKLRIINNIKNRNLIRTNVLQFFSLLPFLQ